MQALFDTTRMYPDSWITPGDIGAFYRSMMDMVFANNSVVAVVFSGPVGNENAGRNITTAAFAEWLDEVIAENG